MKDHLIAIKHGLAKEKRWVILAMSMLAATLAPVYLTKTESQNISSQNLEKKIESFRLLSSELITNQYRFQTNNYGTNFQAY